MNVLILVAIIMGVSLENVFKKSFNVKTDGKGAYFFTAFSSLFAMLFFVFTTNNLSFDAKILPYAIGFGASYMACGVCVVLALSCGPLSLSSLILSYSLILPTLYGLVFLHDPVGPMLVIGIVLLGISLLLVNKNTDTIRISLKWGIFIFISFVGNGMCSIVQKMQQDAFGGAYKNEFMIIALAMVTLGLGIASVLTERKNLFLYTKKGGFISAACGVMNGMVNLFVMILSAKMPVSVMFPLISAGGLIITFVFSQTLYNEKLSKGQLTGFLLGTLSVVFLNM